MDQTIAIALIGFAGLVMPAGIAYAAKLNRDAMDLAIQEHAANCKRLDDAVKSIAGIEARVLDIWEFLASGKRQGGQP